MHTHSDAAYAAAQILAARRLRGEVGPRLPEPCRPSTLEEAVMVQSAVTREMDAEVGGWKCGLPTPDRIVVAPIYSHTIQRSNPCPIWSKGGHARVEPEFAFVFGKGLPVRDLPYTHTEIDTAITGTHLALELIASRYSDPASVSFPEALADGLVNQGLFLGPEVDSELAQQTSEVHLKLADACGPIEEYPGRHPNTLPRLPLYWLVEYLRSHGQAIHAGQVVITGSYAGVLTLPLAQDLTIDYTGLGSLQVRFEALG